MSKIKELLSQTYNQLDEYNKGGATKHNLLWKAMGNIEDALKELEDKNMDKEDLVIIDLFQGLAGETLYINNNRITPDEPMGMMKTICSIKVPKQFLISKLRTVLKELED